MTFTFAVIKKNHILIGLVVFMLVMAGYLNYRYDLTSPYDVELTGVIEENLGDAVFVNSDNVETNIGDFADLENIEDYFIETKITRTNSYAEQIESYEAILTSANVSEEQRSEAQKEIKNINDLRNAITICENLIKLKGIDNVVLLVNGESVNVIVDEDDLTDAQIAQIQNIVVHELGAEVEDIHIMIKE